MEVYIVSRPLPGTGNKLVAVSIRGTKGTIHYQDFSVCLPTEKDKTLISLLSDGIKYINENNKYCVQRFDVIGDIEHLPFCEYFERRGHGPFRNYTLRVKKGTGLHEMYKELSDYIRKARLKLYFSEWGRSYSGYMWSKHEAIRNELRGLAEAL